MKNTERKNRYTEPVVANSKAIFTLPLGGKILSGKVIITGQVVLSGGTTNGVLKGEGAPINLIRRIVVNANPSGGSRYPGGKVVDATPRSLLRYAIFQHSGKFISELSGSTMGDGAAGTYPLYLSVPIYFADANLRRNVATSLNADPAAYQTIQVVVDFGNIADCFSGNDRVADLSGLQCQWIDDRENFPGDTYTRYQEDHVYLIPASQERALDKAMPQDGAFESWLLMAESTSAHTLSDAILQRVIIDGDTIDYDKFASDIRNQMLDDEYIDPSQTATGLYSIDFTDGLVGQSVAASMLEANFKVNNIGGANQDQLTIFTRRLFAPSGYAPGAKAGA